MNEVIKHKALKLNGKVKNFLKSKDSNKVCDRAKNILIRYTELINILDSWTEDDEKNWFKLGHDAQWYVEDFHADGDFQLGTKAEKRCAELAKVIYWVIDENWFFKFRPEIYDKLYNKEANKIEDAYRKVCKDLNIN
jgi:hypothetical protein